MPYIDQEKRKQILSGQAICRTKGELNFCLSTLMLLYVKTLGISYQNISDAISAATDAAEEMRRRLLNPYEDEKIKEHGDIYE